MVAQKKALPKLGQTQDVLRAFVETGRSTQDADAQVPKSVPKSEPMDTPMNIPMNIHESISDDSRLCASVQKRRELEQERMVQRGYVMPESLADKLRIVSAKEGLTCTEIVVEAVRSWMAEYERVYGSVKW